jgi:hypothetical protein
MEPHRKVGRDSCEDVHACQPRGGREQGWADRANRSARPRNVVSTNKPKGLTGWAHKGRGQVETLPPRLPQMWRHRRTGSASLIHGDACGTWSARLSPTRESKPSGEPRGRRGGAAGKSAGHPVRGWRGVEQGATSLHAPAGCLPLRVLHHERPWRIDSGDQADASRGHPRWCGLPQRGGRACDQLAEGPHAWASTPSASCEGDIRGEPW